MEHLISGSAPITLSYIPAPKYDGGDFSSYPQRVGWDFTLWRTFDSFTSPQELQNWFVYNGRGIDELPALLQTWLFFGLLASVIDAEVPLEDFVKRQWESDGGPMGWLITTAELERYLEEWEKRLQRQSGASPILETALLVAGICDILKDAEIINAALARAIEYNVTAIPAAILDQLEGIHFCATLLTRALSVACNRIYGVQDIYERGRTRMPLLKRRMQESRWCPYTIALITESFYVDMQAYAFSLGTVRVKLDHSECTTQYCQALSAEDEMYKVWHVSESCDCALIGPPMDKILQVLRQGKIPLLSISLTYDGTREGKPTLQVQGCDVSSEVSNTIVIPYVTISHVWADGTGNSRANAIPRCQLMEISKRLHDLSNDHQLSNGGTIAFWMDTLCIPVAPEHESLRHYSLNHLHDIYHSSYGVLIQDADLRLLPPNASYSELITRLCVSGWNTRLWTYMEATVSRNLFIQGQSGIFDLSKPPDSFQDSLSQSLSTFASHAYEDLIPHRPISNKATTDFPILSKDSDIDLQRTLQNISKRASSCPNDTPLILATLLNLPTQTILSTSDPASKMQALLDHLPTLPPNLLFSTGPRLPVPGYQWAPLYLTSSCGGAAGPILPSTVPTRLETQSGSSRVSSSPSEDINKTSRPPSYLHTSDPPGLMTHLPAISLSKLPTDTSSLLVDLGDGEVYLLHISPSASLSLSTSSRRKSLSLATPLSKSYSVLLPLLFHDEYPDFSVRQRGVLVEVVGKMRDPRGGKRWSFSKGVNVVKYRGPVVVERTSRTGRFGGGKWVGGSVLGPRWWCVG